MLDNLRDDDFSKPFFEDDTPLEQEAEPAALPAPRRGVRFLGMTPFQRFVISVMLMMTVCLLGTLLLLATGRIGLYF